MIAQLPADPLPEQASSPHILPNAQRETKRLIDMSRGVLQIGVGLCCLVAAALYLQTAWPLDNTTQILLVPVLLLAPSIVFQLVVMRARKRAGIPKVTLRSQLIPARQRWLMVLLFVTFGGAMLLVDLIPMDANAALRNTLRDTGFALILAVPLIWRGWQLGLWEHFLIAASFPLGFGLLITQYDTQGLGWLCLVLGLTQLIAGISLHRRWQAWVGSLPAASAAGEAGQDAEVSA